MTHLDWLAACGHVQFVEILIRKKKNKKSKKISDHCECSFIFILSSNVLQLLNVILILNGRKRLLHDWMIDWIQGFRWRVFAYTPYALGPAHPLPQLVAPSW